MIQTPGLVDLHKDNDLFLKGPETGYHLCVFENLLCGIKYEEEQQVVSTYDFLKFGELKKWVLVDVDGVMKGNPFLDHQKSGN